MERCWLPGVEVETLVKAYGFAVPDTFRRLLGLVASPDGSVEGGDDSLFNAATGLLLADQDDAYPGTPPEFHIIGRTGMDGVTCGCVLHDVRVASEPPLAMLHPIDGRADYLGLDARRGIGTLIGIQFAQPDPHERSTEVRDIVNALGFNPDELPSEQPLGLRPRMPPGWKLAMTADGLGVAGRSEQFAPGQCFDDDPETFESEDLGAYVDRARAALNANHPATALWHLRNAYTFWAPEGMPEELTEPLRQTYAALGRDFLIARLEREIQLHRA